MQWDLPQENGRDTRDGAPPEVAVGDVATDFADGEMLQRLADAIDGRLRETFVTVDCCATVSRGATFSMYVTSSIISGDEHNVIITESVATAVRALPTE